MYIYKQYYNSVYISALYGATDCLYNSIIFMEKL